LIIHIISSLSRGGRERQLSIIVKNSTGFDNKIIYYNSDKNTYIQEYELENKCHQIKARHPLARIIETYQYCKKIKPDAIVAWGNGEAILALFVSFFLKVPLLNFSIRHGIRKQKFSHFFRSFILHISKHVVANSYAGLKANGLKRGFVLYNGIENIPDPISEDEKLKKRIELINQNPDYVFVSVANLVPYKDYFTVLKVLKRVKIEGFHFLYIIIGDGPNKESIKTKISEYDLESNVLLTGRIQNVDDYLSIADIMIHSSLGEGCSNAILEGMKHGLPIVATNVGGTPEITTEKNAFLFDYGDAEKLYQNLDKLLNNRELLNKMGNFSYQLIIEKFKVEKMIENYEKIIKNLINKNHQY
jgi:glycosyltransferase involved in cell wall biosynthesis